MQDDHFIRDWNASRISFTGERTLALSRLVRRFHRRPQAKDAIGKAYGACKETALARKARLTGIALIGGMSVGTSLAVLLLGLAAMTYPVAGHAVSAARASCAGTLA